MRAAAAVFLLLLLAGPPGRAADHPAEDVVEQPVRLTVSIAGKDFGLDALIVRRAGEDKLPVALVTHGSSPGDPRGATLNWLRGWAHDMAHRGWLAVAVMRRGYGASDGQVADDAGTCEAPDVGRYLDAHADDLEAALRVVAQRADADGGRVLAIGDSAGGAAVLALAARPAAHVVAVVNVSGGLGRRTAPFQPRPGCDAYQADLVWNLARFGTTAHMPTLWLYAENDSWFRPGLVGRMRAAFAGTGGQVELTMLPPFGADGHTLFFAAGGRSILLPEMDRFLREHGLPSWRQDAFADLRAKLPPGGYQGVETYLRQPTEKVLVTDKDRQTYWWSGSPTLADARTRALERCAQGGGTECAVAAENFRPVPAAAGSGPGR